MINRKVIHVPIGTTQQMKMSCATFKAKTENPSIAPFAKGGGPKDRGIFASSRHFHKRAQRTQKHWKLEYLPAGGEGRRGDRPMPVIPSER
jgi:hypothetical protein